MDTSNHHGVHCLDLCHLLYKLTGAKLFDKNGVDGGAVVVLNLGDKVHALVLAYATSDELMLSVIMLNLLSLIVLRS